MNNPYYVKVIQWRHTASHIFSSEVQISGIWPFPLSYSIYQYFHFSILKNTIINIKETFPIRNFVKINQKNVCKQIKSVLYLRKTMKIINISIINRQLHFKYCNDVCFNWFVRMVSTLDQCSFRSICCHHMHHFPNANFINELHFCYFINVEVYDCLHTIASHIIPNFIILYLQM